MFIPYDFSKSPEENTEANIFIVEYNEQFKIQKLIKKILDNGEIILDKVINNITNLHDKIFNKEKFDSKKIDTEIKNFRHVFA